MSPSTFQLDDLAYRLSCQVKALSLLIQTIIERDEGITNDEAYGLELLFETLAHEIRRGFSQTA
jgi:hypothetical protein